MTRILWRSAPIPKMFLEKDALLFTLRAEANELVATDTPSRSDMAFLIPRYNAATPEIRDGMDAVCVWFTGYTLRSIADRVIERRMTTQRRHPKANRH